MEEVVVVVEEVVEVKKGEARSRVQQPGAGVGSRTTNAEGKDVVGGAEVPAPVGAELVRFFLITKGTCQCQACGDRTVEEFQLHSNDPP